MDVDTENEESGLGLSENKTDDIQEKDSPESLKIEAEESSLDENGTENGEVKDEPDSPRKNETEEESGVDEIKTENVEIKDEPDSQHSETEQKSDLVENVRVKDESQSAQESGLAENTLVKDGPQSPQESENVENDVVDGKPDRTLSLVVEDPVKSEPQESLVDERSRSPAVASDIPTFEKYKSSRGVDTSRYRKRKRDNEYTVFGKFVTQELQCLRKDSNRRMLKRLIQKAVLKVSALDDEKHGYLDNLPD